MKKALFLFFISVLSVCVYGQAVKCIIPATQILALVGANQAKASKILDSCFKFESPDTRTDEDRTKTRKFRRDYKASGKRDWEDYDVFHIYIAEKTVAFSTTNYDVYMAYKSAFKTLGFELDSENKSSSVYTYQQYKMEIFSAKNATRKLTYNIFISQ